MEPGGFLCVEPRRHADLASPRCKSSIQSRWRPTEGLGVATSDPAQRGPSRSVGPTPRCSARCLTGHTIRALRRRVRPVGRSSRDDLAEPRCGCAQNRAGGDLRKTVPAAATVSTWWGWSLVGVEQDGTGVTAVVEPGDGERRRVRGAYLVGADGSRSRYAGGRHPAGGRSHEVRKPAGDLHGPRALRGPSAGRAVRVWVLNSEVNGLMGMLDTEGHLVGNHHRRAGELGRAVRPRRRSHHDRREHPIQIRSMDRGRRGCWWRTGTGNGRCFLAGDAAHQNPPWGGSGRTPASGDAVDLAGNWPPRCGAGQGPGCSTRTSTNASDRAGGRSPRRNTTCRCSPVSWLDPSFVDDGEARHPRQLRGRRGDP